MQVTVRRTSNTDAVLARFGPATDAGLRAEGDVFRNAIIRQLRGGYTSSLGNKGDFVTGLSTASVIVTDPISIDGGRQVSVGIAAGTRSKTGQSVGLYVLCWELGHHNLFTRHFERDEKWSPAFHDSLDSAKAAFRRVFKRVMEAA